MMNISESPCLMSIFAIWGSGAPGLRKVPEHFRGFQGLGTVQLLPPEWIKRQKLFFIDFRFFIFLDLKIATYT